MLIFVKCHCSILVLCPDLPWPSGTAYLRWTWAGWRTEQTCIRAQKRSRGLSAPYLQPTLNASCTNISIFNNGEANGPNVSVSMLPISQPSTLWLLFLNHFKMFSRKTLKKDHKQDHNHVIINNKVINVTYYLLHTTDKSDWIQFKQVSNHSYGIKLYFS